MGLMDSILGAVKGDGGQDPSALINAVQGLLTESGGLAGLQSQFQQKGLADMFAGWISTGPNPPITTDQLSQVLGSDKLNQLASKVGADASSLTGLLAQLLPGVIDQLTPNGKIEPHVDLQKSLGGLLPNLLKGGLGKLLGGQ